MTQEEKAKAYDEAIEKFDVILNLNTVKESGTIFADDVRKIFPELKESEDEQHRKWILEYLYDCLRKSDEQFKGQFKCAIAWLEKQYADPIKEYWRGYREGMEEILDKYAEHEKQGEQKPTEWGEEPVSEVLEEVAKNHAVERYKATRDMVLAEKCKWSFKAGAEWNFERIKEALLSKVLPYFMNGGEADEVVAKLDEVLS